MTGLPPNIVWARDTSAQNHLPVSIVGTCSAHRSHKPRSLVTQEMNDPVFWKKNHRQNKFDNRKPNNKKVVLLAKDGSDYSLKGLVAEFFKRTSLMGLQQMGNRRAYAWKAFWAVIFSCAVSMSIYQSWNLMDDYIQGKSVQSTVYSSSHPFPTVTVCSNIHISAASEDQIAEIIQQNPVMSKEKTLLLKYLAGVNSSVRDSLRLEGRHPRSLLKSCFFDQKRCNRQDVNILRFFSTIYFGTCFTFNMATQNPIQANPNSLLTLKLDMERNSRQLEYNDNFMNVWVSAPGNAPILNANDGVHVYPGDIANVKYNMKQVVRLKKRTSDCVDGEDVAKRQQSVYYTPETPYLYSQQSCIASLKFMENLNMMQCVDPAVPWSDELELQVGNGFYNVCSADESRPSSGSGSGSVSSSGGESEEDTEFSNFEQNCSLPCSEWIVDNSVSTTSTWYEALVDVSLKSTNKAKANSTPVSLKDIKFDSRSATVKVFHASPIVELVIEEYKYNSGDFAGVVGGNVGLWMGACVISFLESFEIFVNYVVGKVLLRGGNSAPRTHRPAARITHVRLADVRK